MVLRAVPDVFEGPEDHSEVVVREARAAMREQSAAVARLSTRVGADYCRALALISRCQGRLVISGVGNVGLIGRKVAATFSCTGRPSFFLHPTDALHGDLGMVREGDVALLLTVSGENDELIRLLPYLAERGLGIIVMTGDPESTIARQADVTLDVSVERESSPLNLVPTTSTLAMLAMSDALAISAMSSVGFGTNDFARLHPGGSLGRKLSASVRDGMRRHDLPFVLPTASVRSCVKIMSRGRCGLAIVRDAAGKLCGLVTDGDLRRALQRSERTFDATVAEIMTRSPVTIGDHASLVEAHERMQQLRLKALVVINSSHEVLGLVDVFDA